ncbi:hypothetical protein JNB62_18970 [Microbacterium jejuense]|uniref:Uncharacterized protein n=1 Tax=Microbacterium jejuense TaxID=1263637 RepID=A0ABS7HS13_9MICO|nr:hypothetical protein [Microbacterium jejuense]MBW9095767.1 hypothetical protein [Microbacterium jejuense]
MVHHFGWTPIDLVGAAFSLPLVSLGLAGLIVVGMRVLARARHATRGSAASSVAARYVPERRTLGIAAIAVIVLFAGQDVILGYVIELSDAIAWWRYATPVWSACVAIVVVWGVVLVHGTTPPESPTLSGTRRTCLGFGPRIGLIGAAAALVALVATTVAAGITSSPDGQGQWVWLVIPVPNEAQIDPVRVVFYGWAYGVPVLVAAAALVASTWVALRGNAMRPYLRPDTVTQEGVARRSGARGIVRLATAGLLLALAGAWRLIGDAGSAGSLTILGVNEGRPYEAAWQYAEFALDARWGAPVLEIVAFVLLLLVGTGLLGARRAPLVPLPVVPEAVGAEAVR